MISSRLAQAEGLSKQERVAAAFILRNPEFVEGHTARELAQAAGVSPATVTRLCRAAGAENFTQFKVEFVAEWKASSGNLYAKLSQPLIEAGDAPEGDQIALMSRFYNRVVYEMAHLVRPDDIERLCDEILACGTLGLFGTGLNFGACEQAAFKLQTLGVSAQAHTAVNVQAIKHAPAVGRLVGIVTSHTGGASGNAVETARILRQNGILVAAITPERASDLGAAADICIETFRTKSVDRLSLLAYPISLQYVFDLLYAMLLARGIDAVYPKTAREYYAR